MEFVVKRTCDLSEIEIQQINNLFEKVFEKKRTEREFLNQSVNNPIGYSYHSMMIENDSIVGLNSFVPSYYIVNGERMLFANSTDSMVDKRYRDFFNFSDMVTAGFNQMKKDGVMFVYGYPNDNAYPVLIKSKLYQDIGKMHIYCLPIHIGGIKSSLNFLNPLSEFICKSFVTISGWFASTKSDKYYIEKEASSYNISRYKRSDGKYNLAKIGDITIFFKIILHEGIRTAFIIDLSVKSPQAFNKAIKYILKRHSCDFDLLLYPGYLNFYNSSMIRIPRRYEPKKFNLTGRVLNKKAFDLSIWKIGNWDTNLSNYDLI